MNTTLELQTPWPVAGHTNYVGKNSIFVAIQGQKENGVDYIPLALEKGARTIVAEQTAFINPEIINAIQKADAQLMFAPDARRALATLSAKAWGYPARQLKIIAVTGTKGKTTTSWLLHHILRVAGFKTALLSTVKNKINDQFLNTELTTQHPDYLHAFFHRCAAEHIEYVVMEVAAQAYSLQRVYGLEFDGLIFTNFAQAHGEFYTTVQDYFEAKKALFNQLKQHAHLSINRDDEHGKKLLSVYGGNSFGLTDGADFLLQMEHADARGIKGTINAKDLTFSFHCPALIGSFNGYNSTAAVSMARVFGITSHDIQTAMMSFAGVPGRLARYTLPNGAVCFIDHAHNPLSFQSVLPLLRSLTDHLIVISGAGGDRDRAMRPIMGALMSEWADLTILTTDNPRSENPADIVAALYQGVSEEKKAKVICELDREKAIKKAYACSRENTIIALLGKGPHEYQIYGTTKVPFSEQIIIKQL